MSGIGSGLDVNGLVTQLVAAERAPADQRITRQKSTMATTLSALATLKGAASALGASVRALASGNESRTVALSDAGAMLATATAAAPTGSHSIEVRMLGSNHRLASAVFVAGANAKVGSGMLEIAQGGRSLRIQTTADTTLASLRDTINTARDNSGLRASLLNVSGGTRLVLEATRAGSAAALEVRVQNAVGALAGWPESLTTVQAARDAEVYIDGFAVAAAGNRVAGALEGVILDVTATTGDTPTTLNVQDDVVGRQQRFGQFVDAYNAFVTTAQRLRSFDPVERTAGPLLGDASLRNFEATVRRTIESTAPATLGLSFQVDGRLRRDAAISTAALADRDVVRSTLLGDAGLTTRLMAVLDGYVSDRGVLAGRTDVLQARKRELDTQVAALDTRMSMIEKRYRAQFSALDSMLTDLQSTSSFLAKQLK
ncbi:MAG: hypothetical protein EBZ40_06875 [Gammaproteobacteria bacterium]|nr:hypothetical protein [Gammaproteobacteria bacterium]